MNSDDAFLAEDWWITRAHEILDPVINGGLMGLYWILGLEMQVQRMEMTFSGPTHTPTGVTGATLNFY